MYNDNTFDNLFTGYKSGSDYIYPEGSQNLVVKFTDFYLSAKDGDFTTDPVTITSETGEGEDISIGNAPAKVLTATMLNPDGAMDALTWGDGAVYIGAETASASADTYSTYPVLVLAGTIRCGLNASGNMVRGSSTSTLGGTPVAVIANSNASDILYITTTKIGRYNGGFSTVNSPTPAQAYMAAKFRAMPHSVGVLLDANGLPSVYHSVAEGTKQTFSYVPMGVFDFSIVDAYGITFGVEAYDKMTVFDADATEWWNSIDFDNGGSGRQLSWIAGELYTHYGFIGSPTIAASAVNDSLVWNTNPITSYAVTGRDILKWLAEAMGCNARMGRTGGLEFWTFSSTAVASITPDTIVSSTRVVGRKSIPAVTQTVCYNVLGAGYTATGSTTTGTTYYVVANPFIDPSGSLASLDAIHGIVTAIPAYYPITIAVSCADARWDAGDFVTITDTDNNSITVPIMHQAMEWNGMCHATLSATGKQVRDIPESMLNTDLSSMVDSNPSAVVNKIEAHGISADWITSGTIDASVINVENVTAEKVEVKDSNNNTIFSANANTKQIYINAYNEDGNSVFTLDGTGPFQSVEIGDWVAEDTSLYSEAQSAGHTIHGELNPVYVDFTDVDSGNEATLSHNGLEVTKYSSAFPIYTQYAGDGFTVHDDNSGTSCKMSVIKRTMDSAGTTTITLERGAYLAIVTHTNNSTAGQQGLYLIQAYDSNSVVTTITAAANSTLTISGLTLTWTTTNTYRALRLIYLS